MHAGIGDTTLLDQQVAETGATRNNTSGQLFTAGLTGNLIAVELYRPAGAPAGTIEILDSLLPTAQPIASAPIGASAAEGWVYVELDPAPPIVRESSYAILLDEGGWNFDNSNPYDAGSSIHSPAVDMPLYGHELNESIDPLSAGCGWCVDLEREFLGVEALRKINEDGPRRKITGLVLDGKRIARQGSKILSGDTEIGEVTSGTMSPTLEQSIAMGFVDAEHCEIDKTLTIDIRGTKVDAKVVPLPFYKRAK